MAELNTVSEENLIKLASLLKSARTNSSLTVRELSKLTETISHTEISLLENAKRKAPNPMSIKRLAEILHLNYIELFKIIGYLDKNENSKELSNNSNPISIFDTIISAYENREDKIIEYVSFPTSLKLNSKNAFAIRLNENSMEPTIKKDSIIFVKRTSNILSNHIGAFVLNGTPMVKRYFSVDSKIFLRSDNNTNYPDILISSDDDFSIVGEFIGSISY